MENIKKANTYSKRGKLKRKRRKQYKLNQIKTKYKKVR